MPDEQKKDQEGRQISPEIDVDRLKADLQLSDEDLRLIEALNLPDTIRVPSVSAIKTGTVTDVLSIVQPKREFNVVGVKVPSGTDEQPLGKKTIDGAETRLNNGINAIEQLTPGEGESAGWFSIENGLFKEGQMPPPRACSSVSGGYNVYRRRRFVLTV